VAATPTSKGSHSICGPYCCFKFLVLMAAQGVSTVYPPDTGITQWDKRALANSPISHASYDQPTSLQRQEASAGTHSWFPFNLPGRPREGFVVRSFLSTTTTPSIVTLTPSRSASQVRPVPPEIQTHLKHLSTPIVPTPLPSSSLTPETPRARRDPWSGRERRDFRRSKFDRAAPTVPVSAVEGSEL
jgi:hypothetical protein